MLRRQPRILVIDDEPVARLQLESLLAEEGYHVTTAASGSEGITAALRSPPDLVLCDLLMPGGDGFGVLARLRADPATAETPFIFVTASTDGDDSRLGYRLGADEYITKPYAGDQLLEQVSRRIGSLPSGPAPA
jgi:CheY-like chemotaxis protein